MSRHTYSETVKFAVEINNCSKFLQWLGDTLGQADDDESLLDCLDFKGWKIADDCAQYCGLYTLLLTKDGQTIHIINEHEYDGEDWSAFADDKVQLQNFVTDIEATSSIKANHAVQQTL